MNTQSFRFLDLPKDIRLMVYERLPRQIKQHNFSLPFGSVEQSMLVFTFSARGLPVNILATCRTVLNEANVIVQRLSQRFIMQPDAPMRIMYQSPNDIETTAVFHQEVVFRLIGCIAGICDRIRDCASQPATAMIAHSSQLACSSPALQTNVPGSYTSKTCTEPLLWHTTDARSLSAFFAHYVIDRVASKILRPLQHTNSNCTRAVIEILVRTPHSQFQSKKAHSESSEKVQFFALTYYWSDARLDICTSDELDEDGWDLFTACTWLDGRWSSRETLQLDPVKCTDRSWIREWLEGS
ncbi:hypothetical protein P153DRAFT_370998 [Dothidotthia symphoricarpi CBS 119687]|uniref:Uncharacterized protein n=1 Tax=Dothidotthia symphoricarpi CBS 119687 TaxID=1392245 RepID=A0A6A5ZXV3_9PLEO|nr:uncharacterized protein P153DRAFT_370998 [Dothidotthia symphoricarpi CBS 119687]KAF2124106.1 hypothetical protein P153DRAFT_370998 [Dothidotthia symphoricarpi CBS 119687]